MLAGLAISALTRLDIINELYNTDDILELSRFICRFQNMKSINNTQTPY